MPDDDVALKAESTYPILVGLENAVMAATEEVERLEDVLRPALTGATVQGSIADSEEDRAERSSLVEYALSITSTLRDLNEQITDLRHRVDLP